MAVGPWRRESGQKNRRDNPPWLADSHQKFCCALLRMLGGLLSTMGFDKALALAFLTRYKLPHILSDDLTRET